MQRAGDPHGIPATVNSISTAMGELDDPEGALHTLRTLVTDLGIAAETLFKEAMEALLAPTPTSVLPPPDQAARVLQVSYDRCHAAALALSAAGQGTTGRDDPVTNAPIAVLEVIATHFRAMGECALRLQTLAWSESSDGEPSRPGSLAEALNVSDHWRVCLSRVAASVRGAILVCATSERDRAQAIRQQARAAEALTRTVAGALVQAIARSPERALESQRCIEVTTAWRTILEHVAALCAVASTVPPA